MYVKIQSLAWGVNFTHICVNSRTVLEHHSPCKLVYPKELHFTVKIVATTKTCQLAMVEPQKRDGGLTRSSSNVNYDLSTTTDNLWHYYVALLLYAYSYCSRICLDTLSAQTLLWVVIWAVCTEIDRYPDVISTSEGVFSLVLQAMGLAYHSVVECINYRFCHISFSQDD